MLMFFFVLGSLSVVFLFLSFFFSFLFSFWLLFFLFLQRAEGPTSKVGPKKSVLLASC